LSISLKAATSRDATLRDEAWFVLKISSPAAAPAADESRADAPVLAPVILAGAAAAVSPPLPSPSHVLLRGSVLSRVFAPVLSAPLEPDVDSTVPLPLSCSTSLLQAPEALPRLEQARLPFCIPPLCCLSVLPRVRRHAQAKRRISVPPPLMRCLRRLAKWCGGLTRTCPRVVCCPIRALRCRRRSQRWWCQCWPPEHRGSAGCEQPQAGVVRDPAHCELVQSCQRQGHFPPELLRGGVDSSRQPAFPRGSCHWCSACIRLHGGRRQWTR